MNDVGFIGGRGFMRGGLGFPNPDGSVVVHFASPHENATWSDAAVAKHEEQAALATRLADELKAMHYDRIGLDDGVAIGLRADDPRPGWPIDSESSVVVLTAQVAWLELEAR